jgi:hypothetical protein
MCSGFYSYYVCTYGAGLRSGIVCEKKPQDVQERLSCTYGVTRETGTQCGSYLGE